MAATENGPVFVTAVPRSGTTLLFRILAASGVVHMRNELHWGIYEILEARRPASDQSRVLLEDGLLPSGLLMADDFEGLPVLSALERREVAIARSKGFPRWGVKCPGLVPFLEQFASAFPAARFVLLVRDPRGAVNSLLKPKHWYIANAYAGAKRWMQDVERQLAFRERHPDRACVVRYEDLLSAPRKTIERMCHHVGLRFTDDMLHYDRRPADFYVHEGNANTLRPLQPSFAQKWRRELSPRQLRVIEAVARPLMERLDYPCETSASRVGILRRIGYAFHQKVATEVRWQLRAGSRLDRMKKRWQRSRV